MNIRAVAFDTGGTVLDWHGGMVRAFAEIGLRQGIYRDWHSLVNDYRRAAMKGIVGQIQPTFNMDDVHRAQLDVVLELYGLHAFTSDERTHLCQAWHRLDAWPDFPDALARIRRVCPAVSFTMLPLALVVAVSRRNRLEWDAVLSCEMTGIYKPQAQAYLQTARWLAMEPSQILMVACHNFDLDAARACGFQTAFVRRPQEWGPTGPPDPHPHPECTLVVDDFAALAMRLGA